MPGWPRSWQPGAKAYGDFTIEQVGRLLGLSTQEADLFPGLAMTSVPANLRDAPDRRTQLALVSEKARSEFIVAPILMASRDLSPIPLAIFPGIRLDVDPSRGLSGECAFILATAPPLLPLRSPIATIVEAKKHDIEVGLGQSVARLFNETAGSPPRPIFGCVTTGEVWQFLRLDGERALIDDRRYDLDTFEGILGAIQAVISPTN